MDNLEGLLKKVFKKKRILAIMDTGIPQELKSSFIFMPGPTSGIVR